MRDTAPACVLFDLDGTLLDTAPDLAAALNQLRRERGQPALPVAAIRSTVSHGSPGMLKRCFDLEPETSEYAELNLRFLAQYRQAIAVETALFPGMDAVLAYLERTGIPWGIVTNKPDWLTEPLLQALGLRSRAACVVSGDTLPQRKPEPEPLWHACAQVGVAPGEALYIGDAERDVQASRRAGLVALVAGFGYLSAQDQPEQWGAAGILRQPADLFDWLGDTARRQPPAC